MSEYTDLWNAAVIESLKGKRVCVDLVNKNLTVGDRGWIVLGKVTKSAPVKKLVGDKVKGDISDMEKLYESYKYSYPSEDETKRKKNYFKALTVDEMTEEEIIYGVERKTARVTLETGVLLNVLTGNLTWNKSWGSWYYQGKDKDFILLRKWVDNLSI